MVGKTDGERVSIWSVGDRERLFFVGLSLAFFAVGLWFALCHIMQDGFTNEAIFDSIKNYWTNRSFGNHLNIFFNGGQESHACSN